MEQRTLGTDGLTVSAIGLGCMSLTGAYDIATTFAAGDLRPWNSAHPGPQTATTRAVA